MSKTARLRDLRAFIKSCGYGRGYCYSAYPCLTSEGYDNSGMSREQHSTAAIAAEAASGERWFIDVRDHGGNTVDCLTFSFQAGHRASELRGGLK